MEKKSKISALRILLIIFESILSFIEIMLLIFFFIYVYGEKNITLSPLFILIATTLSFPLIGLLFSKLKNGIVLNIIKASIIAILLIVGMIYYPRTRVKLNLLLTSPTTRFPYNMHRIKPRVI